MGSNMIPCSRLRKRSKISKRSKLVVSKQSKVLKVKEENGIDFEFELFSRLPDQLLTEILTRLPDDSVCRFKLVCKWWFSLLSSRYFVSRFINHDHHCHFTLVIEYSVLGPGEFMHRFYPVGAISNHPVLSKSLKNQPLDLNFVSTFRNKKNSFKSEQLHVVASCHDLLLCSHLGFYYVVNLLTRCRIVVPPPPRREQDSELTLLRLFTYQKAGLFCSHDQRDISNGDGSCRFKVILLPAVRSDIILYPLSNLNIPPEFYASQFTVRIFSSESRQWVDISVDWYPLSLNAYLKFTPILFHENMLHWVNGRSLVSLDAHMNLSHSVDLPKELSLRHPFVFGVCQGQFRVAHFIYEETDGRVLRVWDLVDYHKGVWQLAHRVLLHQASLKKYNYRFWLMAFHPYDRDRVFVETNNGVFQFNLRTGILESYYGLKLEKGCRRTIEASVFPMLLHRGLPTALPQ